MASSQERWVEAQLARKESRAASHVSPVLSLAAGGKYMCSDCHAQCCMGTAAATQSSAQFIAPGTDLGGP